MWNVKEIVALPMTPRQQRRSRPIDIARSYQHAAHVANPRKWGAFPTDLDGGMANHPERVEQLHLLGCAAEARKEMSR